MTDSKPTFAPHTRSDVHCSNCGCHRSAHVTVTENIAVLACDPGEVRRFATASVPLESAPTVAQTRYKRDPEVGGRTHCHRPLNAHSATGSECPPKPNDTSLEIYEVFGIPKWQNEIGSIVVDCKNGDRIEIQLGGKHDQPTLDIRSLGSFVAQHIDPRVLRVSFAAPARKLSAEQQLQADALLLARFLTAEHNRLMDADEKAAVHRIIDHTAKCPT